jgi:tetratricopeptide (TPR) repeat protein
MITAKRLLIDLLFHSSSDPRERTIFEISSRLRTPPNNTARHLKRLQVSCLVSSPSVLVQHPSSRRKVRCYSLTDTGKKEAELQYDAVKDAVILVKDSNGNYKKVPVEKLPQELEYDMKSLSSILSIARGNVVDVSELKNIPAPPGESRNIFSRFRELIDSLHMHDTLGKSSVDDIAELLRIKDELELEIGSEFRSKARYKKAIIHCNNVLSSSLGRGDYDIASKAAFYLGSIYYDIDMLQQALNKYAISLKYSKRVVDKMTIGKVSMGMAGVFYKKGDIKKAIPWAKKAIVTFQQFGNKDDIANAFGNLGLLYESLGNYGKAIEACEESLRISKHIGDLRGVALRYSSLGEFNLKMGKYPEAIKFIQESQDICHKMDFKWLLTYNYCYLAEAYHRQNDLEAALRTIKIALKLSVDIGASKNEGQALLVYADILKRRKRWKQASKLLDRAIEIARKSKNTELLCDAYLNYGLLEKNRGNARSAKRFLASALKISSKKISTIRKIVKKYAKGL